MYFFKKFKNKKEIEILGKLTWKRTWTLGLRINWVRTIRLKDRMNGFFLSFNTLCFELSFQYVGNKNGSNQKSTSKTS